MGLFKEEMSIKKYKAICSFLKNSKVSGMKFTDLPNQLSDLGMDRFSRVFDKLFKKGSFETTTLTDAEMRRKIWNYLTQMETTLENLIDGLSVLADDVRDDKIVLATVESNATTPVNDDKLSGS